MSNDHRSLSTPPSAEPDVEFYEHWLNVLAQECFGDDRPLNWVAKLAVRVRELNRGLRLNEIPRFKHIHTSMYTSIDGEWVRLKDAERAAALALSESRLGQWTPVAVGQLPSGAEDVLTWTITGHCDSAHPHRIRALHAEAQQTGEECFYTHWMPKPGGPK